MDDKSRIAQLEQEVAELKKALNIQNSLVLDDTIYEPRLTGSYSIYNFETGYYEYLCDGMEDVFGMSKDEIYATHNVPFEVIIKEDHARTMAYIESLMHGEIGQIFNFHFRVRNRKTEEVYWVASWMKVLEKQNGHTLRVAGNKIRSESIMSDEHQYVMFEHMFGAMFDQNQLGVTLMDFNGKWHQVNDKFSRMLGYTTEEMLQLTCPEVTAPEYVESDCTMENELFGGLKQNYEREKEYITKDGRRIWARVFGFGIKEFNGQTDFIVHLVADIDREKRHQDLIQQSEDRFKTVVHSSRTWFWEIDLNGCWQYVSSNFTDITGYKAEDMIGRLMPDYRSPEEQELFVETIKQLRDHPEGFADLEGKFKCADGRFINITASGVPITDDNGKLLFYRGSTTDITEKYKAQQTLLKTMEDLKTSNAELEQFAYAASHDLQEPVRLMSSYAQLLEQGFKDDLDNDALRYLDYIVNASKRMRGLINSLLDLSRLGQQEVNLQNCDLCELAAVVLEDLSSQIRRTKAQIELGNLDDVYCDALLIRRVLQNLISNAIKFHKPDSTPHVKIRSREYHQVVEIAVEDNGIGIKPEFLEETFTIFKRLNARDKYEGNGIGLSVCRKLVEMHGGKIWITSEFGEGTTVYLTLPKSRK